MTQKFCKKIKVTYCNFKFYFCNSQNIHYVQKMRYHSDGAKNLYLG